jgi:predicted Na+-dependent transporter
LPLPPETAGAIILLACLPGGLSAIHFTASVKGEETMAAALFVLMGLTAVLISPWVVRFVMPATAELDFPHGRVLGFVAISILAPICTGIVLHDHAPVFAPKLSRVLGFVSLVPFIAFTLVTRAFQKGAMHGLGGPAIAAILLFILASMAIGWLMGGPGLRSRQVLATVTSMRNTVVCLINAKNAPLGDAALTPLIAFSLLMGTPNTVLALANAIWSRKSASRAKQRLEGAVPPAISSLEGRTR